MIKDTSNSQEKKFSVSHVPCTRRISLIIIDPLLKKFSSHNHQTLRLKFIWKHFKVVVTCTLAWQPSFDSNFFFKSCIFSEKKILFPSVLIEFLVHLIKHYFINTLRGSLVPPWLRSCAWQNFCLVFFRPDSWTSQEVFLLIFNCTYFKNIWKGFSLEFCWEVPEQNNKEQYRKFTPNP